MIEFSDEEGYGRFLDLHEHYQRYVNVKGFDKCDYLDYLGHFDKLFEISKEKKNCILKFFQDILFALMGRQSICFF